MEIIKEVLATDGYRLKWGQLMEQESVGFDEARACARRLKDRVSLSDDPSYPAEPYGDWWVCRVDCCRADGMRFWLSVVFERVPDICFILHGVSLERDVPAA